MEEPKRLIEVPAGWENGGDFWLRHDGVRLDVAYGEPDAIQLTFSFNRTLSFRFISEAAMYVSGIVSDSNDALLDERSLPDALNPSNDGYADQWHDPGKPRLFRVFHYKAGLIEVVSYDWSVRNGD